MLLKRRGGRGVLVGGYVRDLLLGVRAPKDLDVEVYGIQLAVLESILSDFGTVKTVGRAFGVLRVSGLDVDFSMPRRDSKTGPGHRGFEIRVDPDLDFAEASRRRDLTVNSMGYDPLSQTVLDPHGGQADLAQEILRATDPEHFCEDPLRALRVAQFAARLEMAPDAELVALCAQQDLAELPSERVLGEFEKLLLKSRAPSRGFRFMRDSDQLRFFPSLEKLLKDCCEIGGNEAILRSGEVAGRASTTCWGLTLAAVDAAAQLHHLHPPWDVDLALMLAALCCKMDADGRRQLLERLRPSNVVIEQTESLLEHRGAVARCAALEGADANQGPGLLDGRSRDAAYRHLAWELAKTDLTLRQLEACARAEALGGRALVAGVGVGGDADALLGVAADEVVLGDAGVEAYPAGDLFLARAEKLSVVDGALKDAVQGRDLLEAGYVPGPDFTRWLTQCREVQYETGLTEPGEILGLVQKA